MPGGALGGVGDGRKQQILKQQRWLLFLRHCARCTLAEGQCQYGRNCTVAKQLWQHLVHCKESNCDYARCNPSRELLRHHQKCTSPNCPVCAPVKQYVSKQRQLVFHRRTGTWVDGAGGCWLAAGRWWCDGDTGHRLAALRQHACTRAHPSPASPPPCVQPT